MKHRLLRVLFTLSALAASLALFLVFRDAHGWYSAPDKLRTGTGVYAWSDIFDGIPSSKPSGRYRREVWIDRGEDGDSLIFELAPTPFSYRGGEAYDAKIVHAEGAVAVLPTGAVIQLKGVRRRFATGLKSTREFETRRLWLDTATQQLLDEGDDDRLEEVALARGGQSIITGSAVNHTWFGALVDAEGDPDLRWVDLTVLDPDTHFENGHLSSTASHPPDAFLDAEFRRYHAGKLLVVLTCATGPMTTHRIPLKKGAWDWIGIGSVEINHIVHERWEGRNLETLPSERELTKPNPEERGTVVCLTFEGEIVGSQLRLVGADGERVEFTDPNGFEVLSIPGEPDELVFEFRPQFYHVIFEIDSAPLFPGNEEPENLFDVEVPYLVAENVFYLRWAIGHGVQMGLDTGLPNSAPEEIVEYRNMSFAEILQHHAGERDVRVDSMTRKIEVGEVENWRDWLKSWFRVL